MPPVSSFSLLRFRRRASARGVMPDYASSHAILRFIFAFRRYAATPLPCRYASMLLPPTSSRRRLCHYLRRSMICRLSPLIADVDCLRSIFRHYFACFMVIFITFITMAYAARDTPQQRAKDARWAHSAQRKRKAQRKERDARAHGATRSASERALCHVRRMLCRRMLRAPRDADAQTCSYDSRAHARRCACAKAGSFACLC